MKNVREKGYLTHSKGRLLAYLAFYGKIKCKPSVSRNVMEFLGYKSDGHWYGDVQDLLSEGYIDEKNGCYRPSKKAKEVFEPITNVKVVAMLNLIASIAILLVGLTILMVEQQIWSAFLLAIAAYLCVINFYMMSPIFLLWKRRTIKQ